MAQKTPIQVANSNNSGSKWTNLAVPVLSLVVAVLSLFLNLYFLHSNNQLAILNHTLDLQQKRPFLKPVIKSRNTASEGRYNWSWGAENTGNVIGKLLYADTTDVRNPDEPRQGTGKARDDIIYPQETLEISGKVGMPSGLGVICIVYEEVKESGEKRRWTGFAQYFFTEAFNSLAQTNFEPEMQLVHRTEILTPNAESCDAISWWHEIIKPSKGKTGKP